MIGALMPVPHKFAALGAALRRQRSQDPAVFAARVVLGTVLLILVLYLVIGDNPWSGGIAERVRKGDLVRSIDYARTWGWWTAAANALVAVGLFATARWWLIRGDVVESADLEPLRGGPRYAVALLVVGAMISGAVLAQPRLSHSLRLDEEYSVQSAIDGEYTRDDGGQLEFRGVRWRETFWFYRTPNNHVPFSILARLSLAAWRGVARPELRFVNETALRMPAYLAGIAAIGCVAFFLWRIGEPLAAVFAAWLMALHPWHTRYAAEARSFSMVIALVPLTLTALVAALHRGTWARWALFGLLQCLLLWTFPAGAYLLVMLNLVAAAALWRLHGRTPRLRQQAARWAVANLVGAAAWAQLMMPNMMQFLTHLERTNSEKASSRFVAEVVSHFWTGVTWKLGRLGVHYVELGDFALAWPRFFWFVTALTIVLVLAGFVRLLRAGGTRALLALPLLLPGPLMLLISVLRGDLVYPRYFIFALPCFAALLGIGLGAVFERIGPPRIARTLTVAAAVLYLTGFAWMTHPIRTALRAGSLQPVRESVEFTRPSLDPFAPQNRQILTASFQRAPYYYDPLVHWIETRKDLRALMRRAGESGHTLLVNYGRPDLARKYHPDLMEMMEEEDLFEHVATFYGFEPRGLRHVYRYRGGASGD